jgi:adenosine deaminase
VTFPKIELHVHLEGTVRPETLLEIARRNDYSLPADTVEGIAKVYDYRDLAHFIESGSRPRSRSAPIRTSGRGRPSRSSP